MQNRKFLTVMLDMSRNGPLKVETIKHFADIAKKMGYNAVGLYMEDVYEIDGEPYFGHLRGRYSKAELKEVNSYLKSIDMVAIPYIQTLAHIGSIFQWSEYSPLRDIRDILLIDEPKTYELIEKMFATMRECFDTDQINIGMDEAGQVGLGNYLRKHGYKENRVELLYHHLQKVLEIAKKYNFKPTMWADLFFSLPTNGKDLKEFIPKDVTLCYWNYYTENEDHYDKTLKKHKALTGKVSFAGGAWTWSGFAPQNERSLRSMEKALSACRTNEIDNVVITMWGDDGNECSFFSVLPSLFFCAEKYLYGTELSEIKLKFETIFGISFDDFMKLDLPNHIKGNIYGNPSRYGLYNDPFCGKVDYHIAEGDGIEYQKRARQLALLEKKTGEYSYLFTNMKNLCRVMELKYDLGVRTRNAYLSQDKEKLFYITEKVYPELLKRLEKFYQSFLTVWDKERKAFGFEVQDLRIGAVMLRLRHCQKTLKEYLAGKIDKIEELEVPVLQLNKKYEKTTSLQEQWHGGIVTANVEF